MKWKKPDWLCLKPEKNLGGKAFPPVTEKLTPFYSAIDTTNRWQGDVFPSIAFPTGSLPTDNVPYWMLLNRTCQLYTGHGRQVKLPHLNFAAVYPLYRLMNFSKKTAGKPVAALKTQIKVIVSGDEEELVFLPADKDRQIAEPLCANLNLITTLKLDICPPASSKILQLSSPFSESVFQRFARFFYTVGFDGEIYRAPEYLEDLTKYVESKKPTTP